jgi:tetratricopeptide (TPR) repeat protein
MRTAIGSLMVLTGAGAAGTAALQSGLEIAKAMAAASPADTGLQHKVAQWELSLARAFLVSNTPGDVAAHARAGIAALLPLLAHDGGNADWQGELAELRLILGDALAKQGDFDGALAAYNDGRTASEALAAAHPEDGRWQHEVVASLMRIASADFLAKRPDDQWTALQAASAAAAQLAARQGIPPQWRRDLIAVSEANGSAELARNDFAPALTHYKETLSAADALVAQDPADPISRSAQAVALNFVGMGYKVGGQPDEAQPYFDRSTAAFAALKGAPATP